MFKDRNHAAALLADELMKIPFVDPVVLAIPRGGLPLGVVIVKRLKTRLSVLISKKIGHPSNTEYAIGAVTLNDFFVDDHHGVSEDFIRNELIRIRKQIRLRMEQYGLTGSEGYKNKDVILVDDGIATGRTIKAGIRLLRKHDPSSITVAVPLSTREAALELAPLCDHWICLNEIQGDFPGVGAFYHSFEQVSDQEAIQMLRSFS